MSKLKGLSDLISFVMIPRYYPSFSEIAFTVSMLRHYEDLLIVSIYDTGEICNYQGKMQLPRENAIKG